MCSWGQFTSYNNWKCDVCHNINNEQIVQSMITDIIFLNTTCKNGYRPLWAPRNHYNPSPSPIIMFGRTKPSTKPPSNLYNRYCKHCKIYIFAQDAKIVIAIRNTIRIVLWTLWVLHSRTLKTLCVYMDRILNRFFFYNKIFLWYYSPFN